MKPNIKIASTKAPDGGEVVLFRHDEEFFIRVDGRDLMTSRQHESELELARLGCLRLADRRNPTVLVGGLGMGYTLRQTLDMLEPGAFVVVAELLPDIVEWNLKFLGGLNGHPLRDKRVVVKTGDILELLRESEQAFDTILLDVDNGPRAMVSAGNRGLYTMPGIRACCRALTAKGCLAVWSSHADKPFERRLMKAGLHVRRFSAPAYKGSKSQYRYIWIASASTASLPPGGGEPLLTPPRLRGGRAPFQRRRY